MLCLSHSCQPSAPIGSNFVFERFFILELARWLQADSLKTLSFCEVTSKGETEIDYSVALDLCKFWVFSLLDEVLTSSRFEKEEKR